MGDENVLPPIGAKEKPLNAQNTRKQQQRSSISTLQMFTDKGQTN